MQSDGKKSGTTEGKCMTDWLMHWCCWLENFSMLLCRSAFPLLLTPPFSGRFHAAVVLLGLLLAGCNPTPGTLSQFDPSPATAIESLNRQKENSAVVVAGRVVTVAPLIGRVAYEVQDATGTIWVLAPQAPAANSEVKVHGTLRFESVRIENQETSEVYIQQM
jgi:hypothetical protein